MSSVAMQIQDMAWGDEGRGREGSGDGGERRDGGGGDLEQRGSDVSRPVEHDEGGQVTTNIVNSFEGEENDLAGSVRGGGTRERAEDRGI